MPFPPFLTDINHQLTNVFTLREEFVLVFQEYGSRTQAYSLAYNRRGKNCGLYKVTLKRSLNGLCSHSATWPCSRQTLRVRHACICKFVFVFALICKFVFVFAWICKCCTWANTSINTSYLAPRLREEFCSSKFGLLVHFYRRCLTICNFFDPKGFLQLLWWVLWWMHVTAGRTLKMRIKSARLGVMRVNLGAGVEVAAERGTKQQWWSWKGHDVDDGDGDVAPEEKVTRPPHSFGLADAAIRIGTQFNVGN